jgi:hypothetical protein
MVDTKAIRRAAFADAAAAMQELETQYAGQVYAAAYKKAKEKIIDMMLWD